MNAKALDESELITAIIATAAAMFILVTNMMIVDDGEDAAADRNFYVLL